jgi:hypothetical protein
MSPQAKYIKRRIKELQRELEHIGEDARKQYWRDYYVINRDAKLSAANERNRQRRANAQQS